MRWVSVLFCTKFKVLYSN